MKTLLVGNFGAQNIGDELILLAALEDYPDATVMTADEIWTNGFCEKEFSTLPFPPTAFRSLTRYIFSKSYRQELKALTSFDQIVFAGGGLFAIRLRACLLWYLVFRWLKRVNPTAEFRFEYQGIDVNLSWLGRWFAKQTFKKADSISVRDEISGRALRACGMANFIKATDRVLAASWHWREADAVKPLLLVNALKPITQPQLTKLHQAAASLELVFVAFQHSDLDFVPPNWPGRIIFPPNYTELFQLFDQAEIALGERLHFLITATKIIGPQATKLLRPPYSEKVYSFQAELGWGNF